MLDRLSEWMSATSFAMRRVRLDDMVGRNLKMRLLKESSPMKIWRGKLGCEENKVIVATRPKAALCCETRGQRLFCKAVDLFVLPSWTDRVG